MSNKVLITGLALGIDNGACQCSNYNIDWLFQYPSTLLWAKKIVTPKIIYDIIVNDKHSSLANKKGGELSMAIKLIFQMLEAQGIIEVVDTSKLIDENLKKEIYASIEHDIAAIREVNQGAPEKEEEFVCIGDHKYCIPAMWTMYAGIIYSRILGASCLASETELEFYKFKFRSGAQRPVEVANKNEVIQKILMAHLPNEPISHRYLIDSKEQCSVCKKEAMCSTTYLGDIEKRVTAILTMRDADEIQQLLSFVDKIHEKALAEIDSPLPDDVLRLYNDEMKKINKSISGVLPKVQRWASLTTMISMPFTFAGLISHNQDVAIAAGAFGAFGKSLEEAMKFTSSKYKWLGFMNSSK